MELEEIEGRVWCDWEKGWWFHRGKRAAAEEPAAYVQEEAVPGAMRRGLA